jgi:hypothetical protein
MAWRYCPKCGSAMDAPTIREVMKGEQRCAPQWTSEKVKPCDYTHTIEDFERDQAIEEFIERVERIEAVLTKTRLGGYPNELPT